MTSVHCNHNPSWLVSNGKSSCLVLWFTQTIRVVNKTVENYGYQVSKSSHKTTANIPLLDCENNPQAPLAWLKIIRLVYTLIAYIPFFKWWSISSSILPSAFVCAFGFSFSSEFQENCERDFNSAFPCFIKYNFLRSSVSWSNIHISPQPSPAHNAALIFSYWLFSPAGWFLRRLVGWLGCGCIWSDQAGGEGSSVFCISWLTGREENLFSLYFVFCISCSVLVGCFLGRLAGGWVGCTEFEKAGRERLC